MANLSEFNGHKGYDIIFSLIPRRIEGEWFWFSEILRHYIILHGEKRLLYYSKISNK